MRRIYPAFILTILVSLAVSAENGPQFSIQSDKTSYLRDAPFGLLMKLTNPSDAELTLYWADQWPPPARPGPTPAGEVPGILIDETSIILRDKTGREVLSYPLREKTLSVRELKLILMPPEKVEELQPKATKEFRLKLSAPLAPGDYTLECRLPSVALKKGGEPIRLSGKLNLKIEDENEAGKPFAPELALEKKPDGFSIKCKLSPPRDVKMEVPFYKALNCRIVVRDDQNRIVVDKICLRGGQADPILAWTEPLEWSIHLPVEFYFPAGAGKYTVEFSYRDYALPKGERREKAPQDTDFYWGRYLSAEDLTKDPVIWPRPWTPVKGKPWTPVKGVWVTAVKKWDCEVTPEMAKAGKK